MYGQIIQNNQRCAMMFIMDRYDVYNMHFFLEIDLSIVQVEDANHSDRQPHPSVDCAPVGQRCKIELKENSVPSLV